MEQEIAENSLDVLKDKLEKFCENHQIDKFEPDEIIELLEDGEAIDWIASQIFSSEEADKIASFTEILVPIKTIVHPGENEAETLAEVEPEISPEEISAEQKFDLSALTEMELPEGMALPPGVDMNALQQMLESPKGQFISDFSLFCQEKGIDMADMEKDMQKNIQHLQSEWMETPREAFEGKTPRQMMEENPEMALPQKVETYRREEPKVGRNDPCPCGSGKKYKKCCGKGM